ncbi:MAG: VOC family protein [bacterium]
MDIGLTHIALPVRDIQSSIAFYNKYANMKVVHQRADPSEHGVTHVAWLSDRTRPFVVVLIEVPEVKPVLSPIAHLGVGCKNREEVDRLCEEARQDGRLIEGPTESGTIIGYWAFLRDPDGHTLELSYGQEVGLTVNTLGK